MTTNITQAMPTDGRGAWRKFICLACGYIYDEALGSPEDGLAAGTRFEDIPDDWQCPLCGVKKRDFEPYEEVYTQQASVLSNAPKKGVVVIGAGLAGWSMVEAIRALDKEIAITLISADSADRYHKPMLSVAIGQNKTASELVRSTGLQSALDNQVHLLAHTFVTDIDTQTQMVHTTRGNVAYTDLVLAIGATPVYPPSITKDQAWHINHLEPFTRLQQRLDKAKQHVVIVGAGMVGAEFAEDLLRASHQVSLIDVCAYPLANMLPQMAGERILTALQGLGIDWLGLHQVVAINKAKQGYELTLLDGQTKQTHVLGCDEVVVATGLAVDERLPIRAGLIFEPKTGIAVHPQTLQTNIPHIYALGDCVGIDGVPCRYVAVHRQQAATIAHQILQLPHAGYHHKAPMIRLKNKSINVTATGVPKADGNWRIVKDGADELLLEMILDDTILATATLKTVSQPKSE